MRHNAMQILLIAHRSKHVIKEQKTDTTSGLIARQQSLAGNLRVTPVY